MNDLFCLIKVQFMGINVSFLTGHPLLSID